MIKAVILDFDQTMFDTSNIENYRNQRQWDMIKHNLYKVKINKDFRGFYNFLKSQKIKIAIVSKSPYMVYMKNILDKYMITVDSIIDYTKGGYKKPSPEPILSAICEIKTNKSETIGIGDSLSDIKSYNFAGIKSFLISDNDIKYYNTTRINNFDEVITYIKGENK